MLFGYVRPHKSVISGCRELIFLRSTDRQGNNGKLSHVIHRDGERLEFGIICVSTERFFVGILFYVYLLRMLFVFGMTVTGAHSVFAVISATNVILMRILPVSSINPNSCIHVLLIDIHLVIV